MTHELDKHLHLKGPNIGKPNFYLVAQMYPEYSRKMLIDWYSKKDAILSSHHKHKRFKLDNPNANGAYPAMEDALEKYIIDLRARGVCVSSFMIKVEAMRILRSEADQNGTECNFRASDGWFANFIKRKKFSLRRITTSGLFFKRFCLFSHEIIIVLMNSWQFNIFSWIVLTNCFLFYCSNNKLLELKPSLSTFKIRSANTFSCFSNIASSFIFRLIFVFKSAFQKLKSFINQSFIDFESSRSS